MKAAFYEGNRQISVGMCTPVAPRADEVQLKVSHCGICGTDLHIFHGVMDNRVTMPQIMGHEMSGTVSEVGANVSGFQMGDPVAVMPLDSCGDCPACRAGHQHICHNLRFLGIETPGAFQSYWTVPAKTLYRLPNSLSLTHGALMEPLAVACHDVRLGEVKTGDNVVVLGGGPIGMLVALVAQEAGANVTLSEINPFRVKLAQSLGFQAINPKETDLVAAVMAQTDDAGADVVFEVSGSGAGTTIMTELVRARGLIVVVAIFGEPQPIDLFRFFWREIRMRGVRVYELEDFNRAIELADSGKLPLDKIITNIRPLEALKAGFEEMEQGGATMKILLEV